ncbi:MAG: FMN-binding protein [Bacteroidota bacterium]
MKSFSLILFAALLPLFYAPAQVYLTRDEALELYFPGALSIGRKTVFLTDEQVRDIQNTARARVNSRILTYYVGEGPSGPTGYAFFETHVVRTMPETFMAVVNPDGTIRAVEILAFYEPEDYLPPKRWLGLFRDRPLSNDLWLKRGVQNIVGATLSAQAITEGVRRALAAFEHVVGREH